MRRKLFNYTIAIIAGICSAFYLKIWISICIICVICLLCLFRNQSRGWNVLLFCFAFGILIFVWKDISFHQNALADDANSGVRKAYIGQVMQVNQKDDETCQIMLKIENQTVLARYDEKIEYPWLLIGYEISFDGNIKFANSRGNPRCFDYQLYLRTQNVGYITTIESFQIEEGRRSFWAEIQSHILQMREEFLFHLGQSDSSGLIRGILFGDTDEMNEEEYNAFRQNGTAHVLAVSGLHIGMLYSVYQYLIKKLHTKMLTILFLLFLVLYGTATLWSVSVTRAVFLIGLTLLGDKLHRRYDLLTGLAAAALITVVRNPYVVFGAGFQMSFLAVMSIIFLQNPLTHVFGEKFSTSAAVQIGLMPYMAYVFNYVTFVGFLCNIPVVFLISIFVPIGMAGFILYFVGQCMLPQYAQLLNGMAEMISCVNRLFCADGILSFDIVSPPLWLLVLFYGMLFYCTSEQVRIYFGRNELKKAVLPVILIIIATVVSLFANMSPFDKAELIFVDVGQGDCIHIKDESGRNVLIDGGGNKNYNVGEKILKPYLLKNGCSKIDLAAATHLHTDHYLGLKELEACFPVEQRLYKGKTGDVIPVSKDIWLEILWPVQYDASVEDENLNSLIFMVYHNGIKTLVTGDITVAGEELLLDFYKGTDKLQSDILKIAHHGSAYSSSDAFIEEVNPKIAVIGVGNNHYGHPSEIVIEKLEKKGIMVFRTDLNGAVGIINRKGTISVCTEKQQ